MEALKRDHRDADLTDADRAMLDYAVELTLDPGAVDEHDVESLRDAGFDDRAIHDIAHVTAYYNYVNRMAEGLGVELEDFWDESRADELMGSAGASPHGAGGGPDAEERDG